MIRMSILFPLGIGFIIFGIYEYTQHGFTSHVGLLLFMGILNTIYTAFKAARKAGR